MMLSKSRWSQVFNMFTIIKGERNLNKKCQILENNLDGMFRQFHEVILQKS